jgi:hypothetical protein
MSDEQNGHGMSRLDRIEQAIESLADEFREEHKRLLTAQILLVDRMGELTERIDALAETTKELAEAQKGSEERLDALILTVDDLIRRLPT